MPGTLIRQTVCVLESKGNISRLLARLGDNQEENFSVFSTIAQLGLLNSLTVDIKVIVLL